MKKAVVVKPLALKHLHEAYWWYENQVKNLGEELLDEWESVANHISYYSESYSKKYKNFRQALLKRFPYVVIYEIEGESIIIYNFINTKRHPTKRYKKKK